MLWAVSAAAELWYKYSWLESIFEEFCVFMFRKLSPLFYIYSVSSYLWLNDSGTKIGPVYCEIVIIVKCQNAGEIVMKKGSITDPQSWWIFTKLQNNLSLFCGSIYRAPLEGQWASVIIVRDLRINQFPNWFTLCYWPHELHFVIINMFIKLPQNQFFCLYFKPRGFILFLFLLYTILYTKIQSAVQ